MNPCHFAVRNAVSRPDKYANSTAPWLRQT
jgi:hypothetical protein